MKNNSTTEDDHEYDVMMSIINEIINALSRNRDNEDFGDSKPEPMISLAKFLKNTSNDFLRLGIDTSSNYNECSSNIGCQVILLNSTPLRSFHCMYGCMDFSTTHVGVEETGKKRMREQMDNHIVNAKKGRKKSKVDEHPTPINPPPEIVQRIGPMARPIFLYRKQLVDADIKHSQNRLFVNNTEKLVNFLTEEEWNSVKNEKLGFVGIDRTGREYNLSFTTWGRVTIINKEWFTMVRANQAKADDWVDLWGYRYGDGGKFRVAFDFREQL